MTGRNLYAWSRAGSLLMLVVVVAATHPPRTAASSGSYSCEGRWIEVMFAADSRVRLHGAALVDESGASALQDVEAVLSPLGEHAWHRICDVPESRLDELQANGTRRTGKPIYNLNNIYRLQVAGGLDVWEIAARLEALPGVTLARPVPLPQPLPVPPDYRPNQGYARPAASTPSGIDSDYAGTFPGGDGTGVTICDLEYSWNYTHGDVTKALGSQINANLGDPLGDNNHGTAVIGEMVADSNSFGVTGLSPGANLLTCGTYYGLPTLQWNVPGAIAVALAHLAPGDVILLEQQWEYADPGTIGGDLIPIEWWLDTYPHAQTANSVWVAIQNAVANGINVVEAGGNGSVNTDALSWFFGAPWYSSSGAIIVGGGGAYAGGGWPQGDLERLGFSSYGSRFDLQGWGENVYTTGYGGLWSTDGSNYYYTATFNGTSSASPMVASAIADCVGYWVAQGRSVSVLTPAEIRRVLVNTGTPQINPGTGAIGPRPDLRAAFGVLQIEWVEGPLGPISDAGGNSGISWVDYDSDGDFDLYLANNDYSSPARSVNRLLRNDGDWDFVDVTAGPLADSSLSVGSAWSDYDNDGDPDGFITNSGGAGGVSRLLRNDGSGSFTDVASSALASDWNDAAWGDYDNDGDPDLYLAGVALYGNRLFRNDGASGFSDVTADPLAGFGLDRCVAWADYDDDGDLDLYLGNVMSGRSNQLLRNDGSAGFADVTSGPLGTGSKTTALAWGDYDNDGDLDLFMGHYALSPDQLLRNDGGGSFTDVTPGLLASLWETTAAAWGDYDNDGDLDLYVAHAGGPYGDVNHLYQNDGSGGFIESTMVPIQGVDANGAPAAWADYDGDGDLDLYAGNSRAANSIFRNDNTHGNHWLQVRLVGASSSRDGIGARVRVVAGSRSQLRELSGGSSHVQAPLAAHFGLGSATVIDTVEVRWPSGTVDVRTPSSGPLSAGIAVNDAIVWLEGHGPVTTGVTAMASGLSRSRLHPNAPNPFNPVTMIRYDLAAAGPVRLCIFDVAGRLVRTLVDDSARPAGEHRVDWNGRSDDGRAVASGLYFYRLEAGEVRESRRMVLMK